MKISNFFSKLEIQFFPYILLVTSLSFCKNPSLENPCDPNHSVYYEILLSKIFSGKMGNHCGANINKVIAPIFSQALATIRNLILSQSQQLHLVLPFTSQLMVQHLTVFLLPIYPHPLFGGSRDKGSER